MSKVPASRPKMSREDVEKIIKHFGLDRDKFPVCVLAVRGYYLDSMGVAGQNDRNLYDDSVFVDTPNVFVASNWNTDASGYRIGKGTGAEKGMAMLAPGVWDYQIGAHRGKSPAGVQAGPVIVNRDGSSGSYPDTGWFGINLHWGSNSSTSSLGCQTAPPDQWPTFINPLVTELKRYKQKVFKYILITEQQRREILAPAAGEPLPKSKDPVPVHVGHNMAPAVNIIKEFEGFFAHAYKDPVGIPTIGWGTILYPNGQKVKMGDTCTAAQATEWLLFEMNEKSRAIADACKVPLSDNEFCALTSFAYNVGVAAFLRSGLLQRLNAGAPKTEVAAEFLKWVYAGGKVLNGLVRRRKEERELFLTHDVQSIA